MTPDVVMARPGQLPCLSRQPGERAGDVAMRAPAVLQVQHDPHRQGALHLLTTGQTPLRVTQSHNKGCSKHV